MELRLGPIPLRIRGSFLFVVALFSFNQQRPEYIAVSAAVVFVSILIHELGHALMARGFGLEPSIELHGMGGLTSYRPGPKLGHGKQMLISLAGPFAGFLFFAIVMLVTTFAWVPRTALAMRAVEQLAWVNVGWGILNLVPLLPMDGGNVLRSFLMIVTKGRGEKPARVISIVTCALFLLYALNVRSMWLGFLGFMFMSTNVQALRGADRAAIDAPLAQAIEQAYAAIDRQDGAAVTALLRPVLDPNATPELRELGVRLYAYGLLLQESWGELLPLLSAERVAIGPEELRRYATAARGVGREDDARAIESLLPA